MAILPTRKPERVGTTREKLLYNDRATVGAEPEDVGEQTLIAGSRMTVFSSGAVYERASTLWSASSGGREFPCQTQAAYSAASRSGRG